jgi:branched-subunit amino acid aminotransferase/4-amino-4-deoxychorismate lyase
MNPVLPKVLLAGRLVDEGEATVSAKSDGFQFGLGLFETIRILEGRAVFAADHLARLVRSAKLLGFPPPEPPDEFGGRCARLAAANALDDGNLKIIWFSGVGRPEEVMMARSGGYSQEVYRRGFAIRAARCAAERGWMAGLKTTAYAANLLERRAAQAAGFDEALFVGADGTVLEGAATNIFFVERGRLHTPALELRILPGVARARVLGLAAGGEEGRFPLTRLLDADEVFATNAVLGVMPVSRVDSRVFDLAENRVTRELQAAFRAAQAASIR